MKPLDISSNRINLVLCVCVCISPYICVCVCVCHRFSRIVGFWVSIVFSHSTHKGLDHAPPQACDETIDASVCVFVCFTQGKERQSPPKRLLR